MTDRRGFTLIELLVSITIFGVMTGFLMANFRSGRTADELRIGAQNVASALREAQTMAFSGKLVNTCRGGANDLKVCQTGAPSPCPGGTCTLEVPHGYGLRANTLAGSAGSLIIYADVNGDRAYNPGEELNTRVLAPSSRVTVKTVVPSASGLLDIVFDPPKPTIYYNNSTTTTQATVTVTHSTTGAVRDVTMNRISGQISAN
jgi:prepilin-type N-terminal cleavage/methylation domain-containing protein